MPPDFEGVPLSVREAHTRGMDSLATLILVVLIPFLVAIFSFGGLAVAWPQMRATTWIGVAVLAGGSVVVAGAAYWLREMRMPKPILYPIVEITLGVGISTQVAAHTDDPTVALVGFVGAVRLIIDGLKRLEEFAGIFTKLRSKFAKAPS